MNCYYYFHHNRLLSLVNVQFQKRPEMDLSENVTFFDDMCCLAPYHANGATEDSKLSQIIWLRL